MSDPPLSNVDFKNKMAWVWTTLENENFENPGIQPLYRG